MKYLSSMNPATHTDPRFSATTVSPEGLFRRFWSFSTRRIVHGAAVMAASCFAFIGHNVSAQVMVDDADITDGQYAYTINRDSSTTFSNGVAAALVSNVNYNITDFTYAQPIAGRSGAATLILGWDFSGTDYAISGYSLQDAIKTFYWGYSDIEFAVSISTDGVNWTELYSGTNVPPEVDSTYPDVQTAESFTNPYEGTLSNVSTFYYKVEMVPSASFSNGNHWGEYPSTAFAVTLDVVSVPEASTCMWALGALGLVFAGRRIRNRLNGHR